MNNTKYVLHVSQIIVKYTVPLCHGTGDHLMNTGAPFEKYKKSNGAPKLLQMAQPLKHPQSDSGKVVMLLSVQSVLT